MPFSTAGYGACYRNASGVWVAAGQGTNTLAVSVNDGTNWIPVGAGLFSSAKAVVSRPDNVTVSRSVQPIFSTVLNFDVGASGLV
jgi:hypothetical protein